MMPAPGCDRAALQNMAVPAMSPMTRKITKITKNRKNRIFAMPAVAAEMPVKPNSPATIEMMKNMTAQRSIDTLQTSIGRKQARRK